MTGDSPDIMRIPVFQDSGDHRQRVSHRKFRLEIVGKLIICDLMKAISAIDTILVFTGIESHGLQQGLPLYTKQKKQLRLEKMANRLSKGGGEKYEVPSNELGVFVERCVWC
jgi:hypothetical protein